jgi:hypothetical protein
LNIDRGHIYEVYDVIVLASGIQSKEGLFDCAWKFEAQKNPWLSKIRFVEHGDPRHEAREARTGNQDSDKNTSSADGSAVISDFSAGVRPVFCDGCDATLLLRLVPGCRCADRRDAWAWPYVAPHPRIVHVVCTAGPKLVFFDAGCASPVCDVHAWLQSDPACCALPLPEFQHLCFAIAVQASAPTSPCMH